MSMGNKKIAIQHHQDYCKHTKVGQYNSQIQGVLGWDNGGTSLPYQQGNNHMKTAQKKRNSCQPLSIVVI
jgi:hypothetical protein